MERHVFDIGIRMLEACAEDGRLVSLSFVQGRDAKPSPRPPASQVLRDTEAQIGEYMAGKRRQFDLPLALKGTDFQLRVWQALRDIPYGETRSYADIARAVGSPKGFRAVGMANNRNPIAIVIPCHRVIGADGNMTGYAAGMDTKARLLQIEQG